MPSINMRSKAHTVKGQGVGSCYDEQVGMLKRRLSEEFTITENKFGKCDITHYHTVNFGFCIEKFLLGKKNVSVCFVHFLPETVDKSIKLPWIARIPFYWYLKKFYNSMDYLVAVNPVTIRKIQEVGITKPNLTYIPNFVSERNFYPIDADRKKEIRRRFDIPDNAFVALGVGQLQTRKGVFDFFEIARRMPHVHFVWAGGFSFGKITDGYEEIQKVVEDHPSNLTFLGIVDREEMNDIHNMSDLMFLPSFDELFPMSVLEALACKKPVLLRDIEVYREIYTDKYLKGSSVDEFCAIIDSLANDKELYAEWVEKSWECHERYNEESISYMWRNLYNCAYKRIACENAVVSEGN